jgi:hypothetical protein
MLFKNLRRPRDCETYVAAHVRAYHWASKAIVYRAKGDLAAAKVAGKKVQLWLRKISKLETHGEPTNGS